MFYSFLRLIANIVLMPIFFIKVIGKQNFKVPGGCVVIANHTSNWDPIILGFVVKHTPVCYMAKEELYKNKFSRFLLLKLHTIPISRGKGDLHAVKTALAALKGGKMLGIFPEGTRSKTGEILPFEQGAALLAMRAGVPVVPVYICGNGYKLFHQVRVYVGEPADLKQVVGEKTSSATIGEATEYLRGRMIEMRDKACPKSS